MLRGDEHIVFLVPGFAIDEADTSCLPYFQVYLHGLQERFPHLEISICALHYPKKNGTCMWHGIPVERLSNGSSKFPAKLMNWYRAEKFLRKTNRENPIDLIHSLWLSDTSWIAGRIGGSQDIPTLATAMGQDVLQSNKYFRRLNRALKVICVSKRHAAFMIASFNKKCFKIIPWGVNQKNFETESRVTKTIDIIGVGNLGPIKKYMDFIDVVENLVDKGVKLNAMIIGTGEDENRLRSRIQNHDLPIELAGHLPRQKVLEKMKQSKVLLHTSTYESQGFVFLEALASGCSIVSGEVGLAGMEVDEWKVSSDTEGRANACLAFLKSHQPDPFFPITIDETVDTYSEIYASLINDR